MFPIDMLLWKAARFLHGAHWVVGISLFSDSRYDGLCFEAEVQARDSRKECEWRVATRRFPEQ